MPPLSTGSSGTPVRLRPPILVSSLQIDVQPPPKTLLTCAVLVDKIEIFRFSGNTLPDDLVGATHGIRSSHTTELQIKLFKGKELYGGACTALWDILHVESGAVVELWSSRPKPSAKRSIGVARICLKCYVNHIPTTYPPDESSDTSSAVSDLATLLDTLKKVAPVNPQFQKLAWYYAGSLYWFLKHDLKRQRDAKKDHPRGQSIKLSEDARSHVLDDTLMHCSVQLQHFTQFWELYAEDEGIREGLLSIGSSMIEQIAYASALVARYAHMYLDATYSTLGYGFSRDSNTLIQIHYQLLCLRSQVVYLCRGDKTSPPVVIKDLIEDLLNFALTEVRDTSLADWRKTSYTAILFCFRWDHADLVFQSIVERIRKTRPEETEQRDLLRRLLTHMVQEIDSIPKSILVQTTKGESPKDIIGKGGFAAVTVRQMAVENQIDKCAVAVKRVELQDVGTPEERKRTRKQLYLEIIHCWTLQHRNVLPLLGIEDIDRATCLVLPYKRNGDMAKLIPLLIDGTSHVKYEQPLVTLSHKWIGDIISGLAYLHDEGVVHGDLRGNNVLVNDDLSVVIADFGLSLFANGHSKNYESKRDGHAQWLAPELLNEQPNTRSRPTKESDIYSFAMVCIETYTGKPPFTHIPASSSTDMLFNQRIISGLRPMRPNQPSRRNESEGLPMNEDLWTLVQRCWHTDKTSRPSVREIEEDLKEMHYIS